MPALRMMETQEIDREAFPVDIDHALKQFLFGFVLVLASIVGMIVTWEWPERWMGVVPPWALFAVPMPVMAAVTVRWARLLRNTGPAVSIGSDGVTRPGAGTIPWDRIRKVSARNGVLHLELDRSTEGRGLDTLADEEKGSQVTLWNPDRSTVGPIVLGSRTHEVAELMRRRAGLPSEPPPYTLADAPWSIRIVAATIVTALGTLADVVLVEVPGVAVWLVAGATLLGLEWLVRRWARSRSEDS